MSRRVCPAPRYWWLESKHGLPKSSVVDAASAGSMIAEDGRFRLRKVCSNVTPAFDVVNAFHIGHIGAQACVGKLAVL